MALLSLSVDQEPAPDASSTPDIALVFELMRTPPDARTRNWLSAVVEKSSSVESAQTKLPSWIALALRPAARLKFAARLFWPPGTVPKSPVMRLFAPPPMAPLWTNDAI